MPIIIGVSVAALAVVYAFVQNHRQVREGQAIGIVRLNVVTPAMCGEPLRRRYPARRSGSLPA
jgi:hypothetical protein